MSRFNYFDILKLKKLKKLNFINVEYPSYHFIYKAFIKILIPLIFRPQFDLICFKLDQFEI